MFQKKLYCKLKCWHFQQAQVWTPNLEVQCTKDSVSLPGSDKKIWLWLLVSLGIWLWLHPKTCDSASCSNQSAFHQWSTQIATLSCCCPQMNWWVVMQQVQMDILIFEMMCILTQWMVTAEWNTPWHDMLETVRLLCNKAQQVGCLRG